ncbi:MAG: PAS domain S-box protein [Bacteroidia bacterium]|nr:PAS domain S-box protein [Bacteroidia bacterium]
MTGKGKKIFSGNEEWLSIIISLLKNHTGHDFSQYKNNTLKRRLNVRMGSHCVSSMDEYIGLLGDNPDELTILFNELLIGVTSFFRDKEAFAQFEKKIIPQLFSNNKKDAIRIWVPACSSGEEVYTIAMLFERYREQNNIEKGVHVLATDIDNAAIEKARSGTFQENIATDIPADFLSEYFIKDHDNFRIKKKIRDRVIFAVHSIIKDPPYSKIDLISCRNLLIYLKPDLQKKVVALFHYSLNPSGVLFLGNSETVDLQSGMFSAIDRRWKIYGKTENKTTGRNIWSFPKSNILINEKNSVNNSDMKIKLSLKEFAEKTVLENYSDTCIIVNGHGDILYVRGKAGKYLEPATGEPSNNIIQMAREGLRMHLANAIYKVAAEKKEVKYENLKINSNGATNMVNVTVIPVMKPKEFENLIMVVFTDVAEKTDVKKRKSRKKISNAEEQIFEMEKELKITQEYLHNTIEELEHSNEKLKKSNEEAQSSNEELQSINEELETSKEELQSVNEELITANTELQNKIEELTRLNDDVSNLLTSTQIGTIFLNRDLKICRFTPSVTKIINLLPSDVGRSVTHFLTNIDYPGLIEEIKNVLDNLGSFEAEIKIFDGHYYLMRILPYRTLQNNIDGVVMTFTDITEREKNEEIIKENEEQFRQLAESAFEAIAIHEKGNILIANKAFIEMFGYDSNEIIGMSALILAAPQSRDLVQKNILSGYKEPYEAVGLRKDGSTFLGELRGRNINYQGRLCRATAIRDLTERIKVEEALKKSEEKYRHLVEMSPDGIILHYMGTVLFANKSVAKIMGVASSEEFIGKNAFSFVHPDSIEIVRKRVMEKEGFNEYIEEKFIRPDGKIIDVEVAATLVNFQGKQCFQTVFRDITDRKNFVKVLEEKEENYRMLLEFAVDAFFQSDTQGNFIAVNESAIKLTGYSKAELLKMNMSDLFSKEVLSEKPLRYDLLNDGKTVTNERDLLRKDRLIVPVEMRAKKMPDATYQTFVRDISERKKADKVLHESEGRYRNLVEAFHDMVFITDYSHRMIYANPSLERQTGYAINDFVSDEENIRFVHPDDFNSVMKFIRNFINGTEKYSQSYESRFINKRGKMLWHSTVISKVEFKGKPALQFICHDITERKEYENRLKESKAKAEESDRLKSAFLANMSHEIRTPMNAIIGFSNLLNDDSLDKEQQDEFVTIIQNSGQQLLTIINDIIDISKIDAGQIKIIEKPCELNQVLNQLYSSYKSELQLKQKSQIKLVITPDSAAPAMPLCTDEIRLKQILSNLLSNAIKFTEKGFIEFGYKAEDDKTVLFFVKDTGIGIPDNMRDIIFEPFMQADHVKTSLYGGTGLGLAISKNLVNIMGGKMWVESTLGEGSVFFFTLPNKPFIKPQKTAGSSVVKIDYNWSNKTILIVEDEYSNYLYLLELLKPSGSKVIHARNGQEAVDICQSDIAVDLALMDIRMPEMTGFDATEKILLHRPGLPVIAQTAYAFSEDKEKCIAAGCIDCLAKPIKKADLYNAIEKVFE